MTSSVQEQKRKRASTFPPVTGATPACGLLDVQWDSPFDRLCFLVSAPDLALKNSSRYGKLLEEAMSGSGCTEEEILAHGNKVRAYLFFAQDRLTKEGRLGGLKGSEKYVYQLVPVAPAF
jgi:hypothetical protein